MQEFIYYNPKGLDFPISEEILVTTNIEDTKEKNFLISNTKEVESELNADEIDFYINNSKDAMSAKIENVLKLYEIAASKYDFAQDISYSEDISKQLLLVANTKEEYEAFTEHIDTDDF